MNFKKLNAFLWLIFAVSTVNAQKFNHGVGAGLNLMTHKLAPTNSADGAAVEDIFRGSIDYFPRYNLVESGKSSVSVGVPVSLGVGTLRTDWESGFLLAADASLGLYYNNGLRSTRDNDSDFGFYIGGGFSYGFTNVYLSSTYNLKTYGPMGHLGVRFALSGEIANVGLFYRHGIEDDKFRTYGLKLGVDF